MGESEANPEPGPGRGNPPSKREQGWLRGHQPPLLGLGVGGREGEAGARGAGSAVTQPRGWQRVRCLCLVSNVTVSTAPGSSPGGPGGTRRHRGWDGAAAGPEKPFCS